MELDEDYDLGKIIFCCPEVQSNDIKRFPLVDDICMITMKKISTAPDFSVQLYACVNFDRDGNPFVDIYIWDYSLYAGNYIRFVIREGYMFSEAELSLFLKYLQHDNLLIEEYDNRKLTAEIKQYFPHWHFPGFGTTQVATTLDYIYFVSHQGYKEILYKAGLINIGKNIELIPGYNMIGSSPVDIIGHGVSLKLLRILNNPNLVSRLFNNDTMENCVAVYREYASYIGLELPSSMQWKYFEELYRHGGVFWGRGFSRTIYRRLQHIENEECFRLYARFFELQDELSGIYKTRIPKIYNIQRMIMMMEKFMAFYRRKEIMDPLIRESMPFRERYEYQDQKYMVKLPPDSMSICYEAITQRNCLMNYLEDHSYGETTVLFIRRIEEEDKPFVTMEIDPVAGIVQVYAKYNELPDRDVFEFLGKYACEKGIHYAPAHLMGEPLYEDWD